MLEEKIRGLLKQQRRTVKELSESIQMSDTAIRAIYKRDSCELSTLRQIAAFFGVSMSYFIDTPAIEINDNAQSFNTNADEVIKELSITIRSQQETIKKLTEKLLNL